MKTENMKTTEKITNEDHKKNTSETHREPRNIVARNLQVQKKHLKKIGDQSEHIENHLKKIRDKSEHIENHPKKIRDKSEHIGNHPKKIRNKSEHIGNHPKQKSSKIFIFFQTNCHLQFNMTMSIRSCQDTK